MKYRAAWFFVLLIMVLLMLVTACSKHQPADYLGINFAKGWHSGQPLYEVYLRAYSEQGGFNGLTDDLDRLQDLGIKTIWLMPIHPIGIEGRKGSWGCPYSVQDYHAVGEEYGTLEELRTLVSEAHNRGMKLILDVVINHSANDHISMEEHPDWFMRDEDGNFIREVADWSDITDWNHDSEGARNYLISALNFWIDDVGIDGYRCDVAGMVPNDFWTDAIAQIRERRPDAFMLAEWEDPWILDTGFDAGYDWNLYHRMKDHVHGEITLDSLWSAIQQKHHSYPEGKLPMRFIENHDEPRAAEAFGWPGLKPYAALIFTLPGIPLLYNGEEIGETHKPSLFEKETIDWENGNQSIHEYFRTLIHQRTGNSALLGGLIVRLDSGNDEILMYNRLKDEHSVIVVINFSDVEQTVSSPDGIDLDEYANMESGETPGTEFVVPALGYVLFQK